MLQLISISLSLLWQFCCCECLASFCLLRRPHHVSELNLIKVVQVNLDREEETNCCCWLLYDAISLHTFMLLHFKAHLWHFAQRLEGKQSHQARSLFVFFSQRSEEEKECRVESSKR